MIASMWNLDGRLAELRPSESELRLARERREAASKGGRGAFEAFVALGPVLRAIRSGAHPSRAVARPSRAVAR